MALLGVLVTFFWTVCVCVAGLGGAGVMDFAHSLNESSLGFGA